MVNTITKRTIHDGTKNLIVEATILGDASGEETGATLIDVSGFAGHGVDWDEVSLRKVTYSLTGFSVNLLWNATTDVQMWELSDDGDSPDDFTRFGGLINSGATGFNGDINFSTVGLGAGDKGSIVLEMWKRSG